MHSSIGIFTDDHMEMIGGRDKGTNVTQLASRTRCSVITLLCKAGAQGITARP
jgi:hypothetical protein